MEDFDLGYKPVRKSRSGKSGQSGWSQSNKKRSEQRQEERFSRQAGVDTEQSVLIVSQPFVNQSIVAMGETVAAEVEEVIAVGEETVAAEVGEVIVAREEAVAAEVEEAIAVKEDNIENHQNRISRADKAIQCCIIGGPSCDSCVGESVDGDPFLWRGIFDLPPQ